MISPLGFLCLRGELLEGIRLRLPGGDPLLLGERLVEAGVVVTARSNGIRVSPHAYSTREEVDRLLEVVGGR